MDQMSREKIVIKALGNTGADLSGALNSRRQAAGLGPVGDLTTYDSSLIKSYLERVNNQSMAAPNLIFAENMTIFADQISLTATVPGGNEERKGELSERRLMVSLVGARITLRPVALLRPRNCRP